MDYKQQTVIFDNNINPASILWTIASNKGYYFGDVITASTSTNKKFSITFPELIASLNTKIEFNWNTFREVETIYSGSGFVLRVSQSRDLMDDDDTEGDPLDIDEDELPVSNFTELKVTSVCFWCETKEYCANLKERFLGQLLEQETKNTNIIPVSFWYQGRHGINSYNRKLEMPFWREIQENYPPTIKSELEDLINLDLTKANGSIVLLWGDAGTGKSFFIRSLMHAWKEKCQINYIIDVDNLFSSEGSDYLIQMVCLPKNTGKFSMMIMEDSGEFLAKDARSVMGPAMSRMLNLADGILGQGSKNIMLISTNEEIDDLNEAASRPGRCIAKIGFRKFSPDQAANWLKKHEVHSMPDKKEYTLAELYEQLHIHQITNKHSKKLGFV